MKLSDWLELKDLSVTEFARQIDVTHATVSRYVSETRRPKPSIMERIRKATKDAVQPNDFF